jgi:hypothetical protein
MPWLMHVYAGRDHYVRLTKGKPRDRQIDLYENLGATVYIEEVPERQVPKDLRLRRMTKVTDGGESYE